MSCYQLSKMNPHPHRHQQILRPPVAVPTPSTATFRFPLVPETQESVRNWFETFRQPRTLIMQELGVRPAGQRLATGDSGSGLSEDKISERLYLETAGGKTSDELCSICLCKFEKKQKIGRLECGHGYHVECIKRWLLSKNVCPMCRSAAFIV